jgi:hypothetical protein
MCKQKYYASGSPLRHLRKVTLELAHPGASRTRSRIALKVTANLPEPVQKRVVELNETGYADGGAEIDPALLAELCQAIETRLSAGREGTKTRRFFTRLSSDEDLHSDAIFVRFALQPTIQQLVCAYFGYKVPYLADLNLLLSTGTEGGKWTESQLWHRDYADSQILRVWVYLSNVNGLESGPFTYIPAQPSRKVPNTWFPRRVADETVESLGLSPEVRPVYGSKQKVFYIDTARCYHLGSRLKPPHERLAYIATFTSHKPLYPTFNGVRINSELSDVEKLLLTI